MSRRKKILVATMLCMGFIFMQAIAQQGHEPEEKPKNLKVLPKNTSGDDIHKIMREYSKALGVHCGFCHAAKVVPAGQKPQLDFASDAKEEKLTARKMIKMTEGINRKYIDKIGDKHFEAITCVTCHNGHEKPNVSVDSLVRK